MKVWIDLSNSPHAQFFAPLVRELTARGVQVQITARQFTQTLPLAARLGLDVTAVGAAEKVSKLLKPINIGIGNQCLSTRPFDANKLFVVDHTSISHCSKFLIETM